MYGLIYKITNLINGKVYIGQTTQTLDKRWYQHWHKKKSGCVHLSNALHKYGIENFEIEQIDSAIDEDSLAEKEILWIKYFNSTDRDIGYNISKGGKSPMLGRKHSLETREKMSKVVHPKMSEEHKQRLIKISKARILSESQKQRLLLANLGRKQSKETKFKRSKAAPKRQEIFCHQNNITYHSIREAARCLNLHVGGICKVLDGRYKYTGKGYTFSYLDENLNNFLKKKSINANSSQEVIEKLMINPKTIYCNNGEVYRSVTQASINCDVPFSQITNVLYGRQKTARGYKFSLNPFPKESIKSDIDLKNNYKLAKGQGIAKVIICNNTIIFQSIRSASKVLNMSPSTIKTSIARSKKVKENFSFKYLN